MHLENSRSNWIRKKKKKRGEGRCFPRISFPPPPAGKGCVLSRFVIRKRKKKKEKNGDPKGHFFPKETRQKKETSGLQTKKKKGGGTVLEKKKPGFFRPKKKGENAFLKIETISKKGPTLRKKEGITGGGEKKKGQEKFFFVGTKEKKPKKKDPVKYNQKTPFSPGRQQERGEGHGLHQCFPAESWGAKNSRVPTKKKVGRRKRPL